MPGVFAVHRHVDDGAGPMAVPVGDTHTLHQLAAAGLDQPSIHPGAHAVARDILGAGDTRGVDFLMIGLPQGAGDRMIGIAFCQSRQLEQPVLRQDIGVHGGDGEGSFRQGAGLVEHHDLRPGQGLQVIAPLDQNPPA